MASTDTSSEEEMIMGYSMSQLKEAMASLSEGGDEECTRHIHGDKDKNHKLSMLQKITAVRILDYKNLLQKKDVPTHQELLDQAEQFQKEHGSILNLEHVIQKCDPAMALAAEFKRASPSKGRMADANLRAGEQASMYAKAGASVISCLTEPHWFQGSLEDLTDVRLSTTPPKNNATADDNDNNKNHRPAVLRKEFIVNRYMITEAVAAGADTVLLIVAILPSHILCDLIGYCRDVCHMEPLVEIHAPVELDVAIEAGARVIGVNNRNLHTFQLDLKTTEHTSQLLSQKGLLDNSITLCALSGMSSCHDVHRYRQVNVRMCLIGESLMRSSDPCAAIDGLCLHPDQYLASTSSSTGGAYTGGLKFVKVCGVTRPQDATEACRSGANFIGVIFVPASKRCVSVQQAQDVVQAVRAFGERQDRMDIDLSSSNEHDGAPLACLQAKGQALEKVASQYPLVVGVFQNQPAEFVRQMVETCGLDLVQLHGNEGFEACNISQTGVPTLRVVDVQLDADESAQQSQKKIDYSKVANQVMSQLTCDPVAILLDTSVKGNAGGGTGKTFDWNIARAVQSCGLPVIIAGGLKADNVHNAVSDINPWGVDVSSGVESSPGVKDIPAVQNFVGNARKAAVEANKGF
mmetsp:Transcript_16159/g.15592  ORF Transcript_16159/g.15592 Transcript_16159/m.15592 type:complete len:634 (-) Transcript_16159:49-1950(-)